MVDMRSLRLSVRTAASHVAKAGSTPAGITTSKTEVSQFKYWLFFRSELQGLDALGE